MKPTFHIVSTKVLGSVLLQALELAGLRVSNLDFIKKTLCIPKGIHQLMIDHTIVLTSKTAVEAWIKMAAHLSLDLSQYRIYCLSAGTQTLCIQYGLSIAGVAKDASMLADVIMNEKSIASVTFICGNLRRDELPDKLKGREIAVHEIEAYQTEFSSIKIEHLYDGVIFFSPSGVDSFLSLNPDNSSVAFCLGETTARHARAVGFTNVYIAETSKPESLVEKVINHYKNQTVHA